MTLSITRLKSGGIRGLIVLSLLSSCSSTPPQKETTPDKPQEKIVPKNSVLEEVTDKDMSVATQEIVQSPKYQELMVLLASLGYEGVGMQYEKEDKLNLLIQVFSNPKAAYRYLRLIYTGTQWGYDARHQSLTIGDGKDANQTLAFIEKNIKLKPLSQRKPIVKPTPVQPVFPKTLPVDVSNKLKKSVPEPAPAPAVGESDWIPKTPTPSPTPSATAIPSPIPTQTPDVSPQAEPQEKPAETPVSTPSVQPVPSETKEVAPQEEEQISPFKNDLPKEVPEKPPTPPSEL